MTMAADKQDKVFNFSSEREQSEACSSSAEREKNQGKNFLNVPTLRFPEFSGEWKKERLKDKCSFFSGGTPSSTNKTYYDGDIPFIRSGEIASDSTELFLSESGLNNSSAKIVEKGDLLLALYGATSGQIAISKIKGAINQAILCIRSPYDKVFLKSAWEKRVEKILQAYLQGGQGNLSAEIVKNLSFYFPSLQEQSKIGQLILLIDERISTQNRIIDKLKSLISGLTQRISKHSSIRMVLLSELLIERKEKNTELFPVHSVSVSEGVVNQIDYLGRSFASADTSHYNVAHKGDIIYTKSPTGAFPFGIVKRNAIESNVAVSPLYGVYKPVTDDVAIYLHYYFCSPLNAQNYLHKLIQKGAKNTINITNQRFLENLIPLPDKKILASFVKLTRVISAKLKTEKYLLESLQSQKKYLLNSMFI